MVKRKAASQEECGQNRPASITLIEQAYERMREDIVTGHLKPGEKLRVEHLKSTYGVSAGTLREAMTRLVSDALVEARGQRGFRVTPISLDDLEDLTRMRVHIEIEALRQSIRHGGTQWRIELETAYQQLSAVEQPLTTEHALSWEACNARFHEVLTQGLPSPWTLKLMRMLSRHGERYRRCSIIIHSGMRDVHAEHEEIFLQAMGGNELRAALALEAHIRITPDLLKNSIVRGEDPFAARGSEEQGH